MVEQQLEQYLWVTFFFVLIKRLNWQVCCMNIFQLHGFLSVSKLSIVREREKISRPAKVSSGLFQSQQISLSLLDSQVFLPVLVTACLITIFRLETI